MKYHYFVRHAPPLHIHWSCTTLHFRYRCTTPPLLLEMYHPTPFVGDAPPNNFHWRSTTSPLSLEIHHPTTFVGDPLPYRFCWRCTTPPLSLVMQHPATSVGDASPLPFRKISSDIHKALSCQISLLILRKFKRILFAHDL